MEEENTAKKAYYTRNKARLRRYSRHYYWRNREEILEKRAESLRLDEEKSRKLTEYQQQYYVKNRSQILAKRAEKRAKDRNRG